MPFFGGFFGEEALLARRNEVFEGTLSDLWFLLWLNLHVCQMSDSRGMYFGTPKKYDLLTRFIYSPFIACQTLIEIRADIERLLLCKTLRYAVK